MTLGGFSVYRVPTSTGAAANETSFNVSVARACLRERQRVRCLLSAVRHLDLSVARSLSRTWPMLKHAPRHLQITCVVLRAHCVLLFFVWIFSSRTEGPRPSQKVSKRICRLYFGLHVASSRSYGTGIPSGNAAAWVRTRIHTRAHTHTCIHTQARAHAQAYARAHMYPLHPPRLLQGLADAATFPESASIILGPNQTIQ